MLGDAKLAADFADDMLGNIKIIQLYYNRQDVLLSMTNSEYNDEIQFFLQQKVFT